MGCDAVTVTGLTRLSVTDLAAVVRPELGCSTTSVTAAALRWGYRHISYCLAVDLRGVDLPYQLIARQQYI